MKQSGDYLPTELKHVVGEFIIYTMKNYPTGMNLSFESLEINDIPVSGWTITVVRNK